MHPPTASLFWAHFLTTTVESIFLKAGSLPEVRRVPYPQQSTHTRMRLNLYSTCSGARTSPRVTTDRTGALRIATEAGRKWGEILWVSKGLNYARSRLVRARALRPVVGSFREGPLHRLNRDLVRNRGRRGLLEVSGTTGRYGGRGRKRNDGGGGTERPAHRSEKLGAKRLMEFPF